MPRLLLLIPTRSYRTEAFVEAARRVGVELVVASDAPSTLENKVPDGLLTLDFRHPDRAARQAAEFARRCPIDGVVAVDDPTVVPAAAVGEALGLRANSVAAAHAARDKFAMRERLGEAGVPQPRYRPLALDDDPEPAARAAAYPAVLKPTILAASRGVIRADDPFQFVAAFHRIAAILRDPEVSALGSEARQILVEEFIPGQEVALEGLLDGGRLHVLALFDKPDPLDGPFFEETIYVTPSRHPAVAQTAVADCAGRAARALGLREGPLHAELRLNGRGPWVLEVAARSIGGLCSRTLRFGTGMTLEELIVRHALRIDIPTLDREGKASGVMMIPIPRGGVLKEVRGKAEALSVPGIVEVTITAAAGRPLVPFPEASQYPGFIFARGDSPAQVEAALREAHRRLAFVIGGDVPITR